MSVSSQDISQWLSVTEETLFLHDGLVRVSDLIELPRDVNTSPDGDHELMTFDSKSPEELSEKLMTVCGAQNNAYSRLLEYRLNALRGYWNAQRQIAFEQQNERDTTSHEEALVLLRKHNLWKEPEKASFSTRVSLLLVLPLLQSQSKFDPSLCSITADLLFNCLHDCPALSLSKEPVDCLNGLEKLLSCWLGEDESDENVERKDSIQKESAAAAFVALACARGHLKMFVHTVHLLLNLKDLRPLPVADLLEKLLETEGGQSQPSSLSGNRHILCWGFEDGLSGHEKQASVSSSTTTTNNANNLPSSGSNVASDKVTDYEIGRSVTSCGRFLYMTSSSGKGLAKIGSGLHGTLRGYIYASNQDMVGCRVAYGSEVLLARTLEMDGDAEIQWLAEVTDTSTLVPLKKLAVPEECVMEGPITTIAFCSDGDYFYWIWSPGVPGDKNAKLQNIFLDCFRYDADSSALTVMKERVLLLRKEEGSVKCLNDTLLARLRPYRSASVAATLVTLTGSESQLPRKEDVTSIGIPLKTLLRTPVYCDGSTVVFLTPAPGGSTSNAARSLFGSGPSLGSLRLACNLCFDVADGMFNTRSDLMDDAACALVRGAQVMGTGLCYDVVNNLIWMVSNDWVDQFCNNGHQALHRILTRLGLDHQQTFNVPKDNMLKPVVIAEKILQHVGAMCLHELNYDIVNLPLSNYVLQHSLDVVHLERVIDIIQYAVGVGDLKMLIVGLIMLQVIFRMNSMNRDDSKVDENINRASKVIWNVFDRYHEISPRTQTLEGAVLREVCNVISTGVSIMYPQANDRWNLLHKLLAEGDRDDGMSHLRDLILIEYSEQLRNQIVNTEEVIFLRLSDELVHYILRIAVKESFQLLQSCKTSDKKEFDKILSSVPMASPCLRYLMALQSHLFRECVLHLDDSGSEESGVPLPKKLIKEDLSDLQSAILTYSSNVFKGAYEVLEMLLETCNSIINNSEIPHLEYWLQGLEHVTKATVLGHLLPVLLTAMTDKNMKCLSIADKLMPQLVQLVILTSQTALLMKNQLEAVRDTAEEKAPDSSITHLIGDTTNLDVEELNDEQEGFLAGLKIPAPWTSGKTVESIHPVRDNYKYKETVHIPGARYLYLRFDPRCSSQYDYDKLVVYAGPNTNSRRVAEYGGNTYGYGSRSVLGSGWPKDLVKVEGDTVTFSFEMRSGREHNTPDKAMWGFLVTVRAQVRDSSEEISGGLPFLVDLALGLSMLTSSMLHLLYEGPEQTKEEKACQNLLKSKLLQRCVWQADGDVKDPPVPLSPGPKSLPRIRLPAEIIAKLREMADRQPPQIRPSIKEAIQPEILEESILSAVIKHFDLTDTVRNITSHEEHQTEEFLLLKDVMSETYKHTYAMIRQLQTIAELEQRWKSEVEDVRQEVMPFQDVFFLDYHLVENKTKELAILCFLKDITMDTTDLDGTVSDLRHKFESEVSCEPDSSVVNTNPKLMPRTRAAVSSVLERLELLLQVNMAPVEGAYTGMIRSISHMTNANKPIDVMIRSDTDVLHTGLARHSVSVPSHIHSVTDDSILDILHLQKSRYAQKSGPTSILQDLIEDDGDRPPHAILIDQLFSFIGSNPENAVSCVSFLSAAEVRRKRGKTRYQALVHMKDLLTGASRVGTATHLVAAVTSVLQYGPRIDELSCGGMANQVQEAFSDTMTSVVQLAASYPMACSNSIGLLCIIPYTRAEEMCLVRSGLVHLLDKLCSLTSHRYEGITSEVQSVRQRISAMAWAGFQVLSDRCVMWERDEDDMEHSGLARQVSMLLTNHLARATQCVGNEAAGSEALQEVLTLLKNLSRSRMGKAILRQPACVSKLLSLLLDQRPSPKLVLIILQLCRVALPLMTTEDCNQVELPAWGQEFYFTCTSEHQENKELKISSLLLAKLGDFLVPGGQVTVSSKHATVESNMEHSKVVCSSDKDKVDDTNVQDGCLSVFVHKREDQSSHEVIQPLLSSESRPFRLAGGGANMEKVVRLDREMTKNGKAEVTTEDAVTALRRAARWAQIGLVVSTAAPGESAAKSPTNSDKKKIAIDVVCKEKNVELARSNPARPFISGHVANSMAAEVIALLHSLLTAPETLAAQCWASAVETVISSALSHLPQLLHSLSDMTSPHCNKDELMVLAKQANAALAALGGFDETIKPGSEVEITGEGLDSCLCSVVTVSEQTGLANVQLLPPTGEDYTPPRYSDTVQVPISRLRTPRNGLQPLSHLSVTEAIVSAVQMILVPQESNMFPISQPLPVHGSDASNLANQICRVVSEIRTRACKVLAAHLQDLSFASSFIQHSSNVVDILKSLAKECHPGDRHPVIQAHCQRLRMLYRDCAKPPPPMGKSVSKPVKEIKWNPSHLFPPLRSCLFSNGLTTVTFFGDPSSGSGLPRGTIVYASQPIPQQAASFYWELEICSFGDSQEESCPVFAFGFMPTAEKKDGAWIYPVGSCLFHNNGRAVHYNGSSLLQWRSVRLDVTLNPGDICGIGWERQSDGSGQSVKGTVFFTYNGRRLSGTIEEALGNMWPVVHMQKKNMSIKANFGSSKFAYAEGASHQNSEEAFCDVTQEIRDTFGALPFNIGSDSDGEGSSHSNNTPTSDADLASLKTPGPPCRTPNIPKSLKEYNSEASIHYKLLPCYENFPLTGPDIRSQQANQDDEDDAENQEDEEPTEDHYALLVRAWEQKVFPTIRRRFRNEAERKDGLEQIRGALQLSMTDIARQTVEFLYEENGGIPRDLHLPTIEDIKEELAKFTIDHVRKGTAVVIRSPDTQASSTSTVIPKFAVRGMLKTFGLTGIVLDVDQVNELVQVETYLRSEGVLVHYWYPVDTLERPPPGYRKGSIIGTQILNTSNIHIHRELLNCESVLARMYCRTALLELINQCNSPAMEISCMPSVSTMAASAALLQQLDVENLQLLSDELLAPPQPHGSVATNSLLTAESPEQSIAPHTCSLSQILYHNVDKLKEELRVAIARAANQGEDYLIELSSQICVCLQTAPEMFHYEEFPVSETKISTDVYFPGAAFLVVSCKTDPKAIKKDTSLYKSPWARVYTYHSHIIRKTGQCSKQEVVCYPRDTSSSSNHSDQYMPVFIPTDRLHVRVGVSPPPGVILMIHALPAQFALAISYIEMLVSQKHNFEYCNPDAELHKPFEADGCLGATGGELSPPASNSAVPEEAATSPWRTFDSIIIPPSVLYHIVELIGGYLWRSDSPAIIKEYIFHLLAQTLRMVQISEGNTPGCKMPLILGPHLTSSFTLLLQLNTELKKLYEEETKHWPSGSTLAGSGIGLGIGDKGRFSTYFHSLMEVALSIAEVTSPIITGHQNAGESKPSMVSALQPPLPSGGLVTSKRKKLRAKRERDRSSTIPKRTDSPHYHSESESSPSSSSGCSMSSSPGNTAGNGSMSLSNSKPEDMLWFHRALTMTQILRYLVYNDPVGQGVILDAVQDAAQSLSEPTAHQRLLIITGIPTSLDCEAVKSSIRKICNSHGGLFKDELYLPIRQVRVKSQQAKNTGNQQMRPKQTVVSTTCHDLETQTKGSNVCETEQQLKGYCIIEVRSKAKVEAVHKSLLKNKLFLNNLDLDPDELVDIPKDELSVYTISSGLLTKAPDGDVAIDDYLLNKLILAQEHFELTDPAMLALTEIFHSCFISEQRMSLTESRHESGYICLGKEQIMMTSPSNLMRIFLLSMKPHKKTFTEQVDTVIWHYGIPKVIDKDDSDKKGKSVKKTTKASSKEKQALGSTAARMTMRDKKTKSKGAEKASKDLGSPEGPTKTTAKEHPHQNEKLLTLDGFLSYVREQIKLDVKTVWKALFTCGYDLHLERCACTDICQAHQMLEQWTLDMDTALVQYVNKLCYHLAIAPSRLHPHELYITEAERSSTAYSPLQGVPLESIRLRFALLKSLNNTLETFFLPLVDLRPAITSTFTRSMAVLLANAQGLIFFDTKMLFINRILNATALRKPDQAPPEIVLDPLEIITGERRPPMDTHFCQALRQLLDVSSNLLCVQLAAGGDPVYAFNVRYTGEEVHGTSGSFRHFLWQVARELESSSLGLFIQCPSSASHRSRGKLLLKPGPMTYAEEKMLQFFGQLLGVTIRADIPFGLDLLPVFWKNLLHVDLDPITDLQEADIVTYSYIKKFEMMESEQDLYTMYADQLPHFVYNSLNGEEVELIPNGRNVAVNWENHQHYVDQIRCLRMKELACSERMSVIRTGLATVFPIQLLALITPADIELRTCGLPQVNVDFLKEHTMYQVGLSDTDPHIQYFWAVLESFSQDELAKFVKFACNQERIPQTCPCKDGGPDTPHVPPYPMKIAPPDSSGQPDSRYIRVETCMFMIKLPQYSNQKLMKERLLYAIHCREDPLSG